MRTYTAAAPPPAAAPKPAPKGCFAASAASAASSSRSLFSMMASAYRQRPSAGMIREHPEGSREAGGRASADRHSGAHFSRTRGGFTSSKLVGRSSTVSRLPSTCTPYRPLSACQHRMVPPQELSSARADRPCIRTLACGSSVSAGAPLLRKGALSTFMGLSAICSVPIRTV